MKLKNIMYALGYGMSIDKLKRREGARRVKLAQAKMKLRTQEKSSMLPFRSGSNAKQLSTLVEGEYDLILARDKIRGKVYTSFQVPKERQSRQKSACHSYKVLYGKGK